MIQKILSADGSYSAYSSEYNECYHSTKDGAFSESLYKHVIPAFKYQKHKESLRVLDICFGLGFNTLTTLYYAKKIAYSGKIEILSPELDRSLLDSLTDFPYPREFDDFKHIVTKLSRDALFKDDNFCVQVIVIDAMEYIKTIKSNSIDIVYQDAFSPKVNPLLWSRDYFRQIVRVLKSDGILTTYSTALNVRIALFENNFKIYLNKKEGIRNATIASLKPLDDLIEVDVLHKMRCNPFVSSL